MRLRKSILDGPGLHRIRRGRGFSYLDHNRDPVRDAEVLARIDALVIPPAWRKVWISPHPNGHIQAVGTDAAGRRQYVYHERWQDERSEEKYERTRAQSRRTTRSDRTGHRAHDQARQPALRAVLRNRLLVSMIRALAMNVRETQYVPSDKHFARLLQ